MPALLSSGSCGQSDASAELHDGSTLVELLLTARRNRSSYARVARAETDAVTAWNANAGRAVTGPECFAPTNNPIHEARLYAVMHLAGTRSIVGLVPARAVIRRLRSVR